MNQPPIRAVLFDLDGVIVSTDRYHFLAWQRLAKEQGWAFDEQVNHQLRGIPRMDSLQVILDHNGVQLGRTAAKALANRKNRYYRELLTGIGPADMVPGALKLLDELARRGCRVALCSSSRNAAEVLKRLGLSDRFEVVVTGADLTHPKPHPQIFQFAAERLEVPPEQCLVVEDAESGVEAALAAGMRCIGFGPAERLSRATVTVTDYAELDLDALLALVDG